MGKKCVVLAIANSAWPSNYSVLQMPDSAADYAARLYAALHEADAMKYDIIFIESPHDTADWQAVRDRIFRASLPWQK